MAVDQAGQDEAVALVHHQGAGKGGGVDEAVADLDHLAVAHHQGGRAARGLAGTIQQAPRLDQGHDARRGRGARRRDGRGGLGGCGRARGRQGQGAGGGRQQGLHHGYSPLETRGEC